MNEKWNKEEILGFLAETGRVLASHAWSLLLGFCLATTVTNAISDNWKIGIFLATWLVSWIVLRVIRYFTMRKIEIFAGMIDVATFQSALVLVGNGIISCFTLARRMSEGGSLLNPIILMVVGAMQLVLFMAQMIMAIALNHQQAELATLKLLSLSNGLTTDEATSVEITVTDENGVEKKVYWVKTDTKPEDLNESHSQQIFGTPVFDR